MAVYIDIITGFLESGKTTFIKKRIKEGIFYKFEKSALMVCEEGFTEYEEEELEENHITMLTVKENQLTDALFSSVCKKINPDYIIMEFNGTWDITKLLSLSLPFGYQIRNVLFIGEGNTFCQQLGNMAAILQPQILNSNLVYCNRLEEEKNDLKRQIRKNVKAINPGVRVYLSEKEEGELSKKYFVPFERQQSLNPIYPFAILFTLGIAILQFFTREALYQQLRQIATIFLSIFLEAVPFILLGGFASAILQIFVPTGWIVKRFSEGKVKSFLFAAMGGLLIPVCDCGMVPIVSGLLKKGTPLPQAVTFWLASSAVNPIVILSVFYAFPGQPYLAGIRVLAGIILGIGIGALFMYIKWDEKAVLTEDGMNGKSIGKDMINLQYDGLRGKAEAVLQVARIEFLRVAGYMIIGAFLSAVFQTFLPQALRGIISGNFIFQLALMLLAAVVMSTCSTSNAFIGKSFAGQFSMMPIMAFMTLGPMLDFKNILMLSKIFNKRILSFLVFLIVVFGSVLFVFLEALFA